MAYNRKMQIVTHKQRHNHSQTRKNHGLVNNSKRLLQSNYQNQKGYHLDAYFLVPETT